MHKFYSDIFPQVKFYADSYLKTYNEKKIVYLTSESENVIDTLEPDCVYIIGGLVDHNSHKVTRRHFFS